jgi:threonine dehydratase
MNIGLIGRGEIADAYDRVRQHIRNTPVLDVGADALGLGSNHALTLKLEHLQLTGSFKVRGAFNNLLAAKLPEAGVVAISGGNHGAAVGYAATRLGVKSTVFVPAMIANEVKIARMRGYGAEVILVEGSVDQVIAAYEEHARSTGALAVHPYDAPGTLTGQGTVGLEIEDQAPDLDTLFVSVGGGGLIGGIAAWYGGRVKIVAVETEGTCSLDKTLKGTLPPDFQVSGISASGLGASSIGELPIKIIRAHVDANIVVSDADVFAAQRRLWDATRIVCEPGGVTALAALTAGAYEPAQGDRIGVLLCGGNAAPNWFED